MSIPPQLEDMMAGPAATRINPLTEDVIDGIILAAGGFRLHPDHDRQRQRNADFRLGSALIELKILEDEGFGREERRRKLAALFSAKRSGRTVYVMDPRRLSERGRRDYERALETPIKNAIKSASQQLARSRQEFRDAIQSILMIVNGGNAALDHDDIRRIAVHRARNDTDKIDGIIVAGAYLHSDGFETIALWPIDYEPVRLVQDFGEFDMLHQAFNDYAEDAMTRAIMTSPADDMIKGPVIDTSFEVDGRTFVKPAPPFGRPSDFFVHGRPRLKSDDGIPAIATIYPELSRLEWAKAKAALFQDHRLGDTYEAWLRRREKALAEARPDKPVVAVPVSVDEAAADPDFSFEALGALASTKFQNDALALLEKMREMDTSPILANRFVVALTEEIGQDERNDVSHIVLIDQGLSEEPRKTALAQDLRIPHLHACALAAAYAIKQGVETIYWIKDQTYAWA